MPSVRDLEGWFGGVGSALVAVSGGVDSALVALAAHRALGGAALAATADYSTLSSDELASAGSVCSAIGIRHVRLRYDELENPEFAANGRSRCFHCRSELAARLGAEASARGIGTIVDGTHTGDLGEYRPGIRAMRGGGVRSPLAETGFAKEDVRREARLAGLPVWDRPSNSCLASRIPWGTRITAERLARIEVAERIVRDATGARQVRVRDAGGAASIEVGREEVRLLSPEVRGALAEKMAMIGFSSSRVDPEGYAPGKANAVVG